MQRFGDGWLETRDGLRMLHTRGTPYESGLQHGVLLRDDVRACFRDFWRDGLMRGSPLFPPWLFYAYAWLNHGFLNRDERLELRGLADGSGLRYKDVLVMNSQSPIDIGYNWVTGGCTQVVVPGKLVARNLDTLNLNRLHRFSVVQVHQGRFLTPGFAGKVLDAISGWNVHGLHVCQDDAESAWTNPLGLYSGALVRRMVEHCATIEEAVQILRGVSRVAAAAKNITVADSERAVLIEMEQNAWDGLRGVKRVTVRGADRAGMPLVTNHYAAAAGSESSATRLARLRQLCASAPDVERAKSILTDKHDLATGREATESDRIINWRGPRFTRFGPCRVAADLDVRVQTTYSTVSDLENGVMWIAGGQPYVSTPAHYVALDVYAALKEPPRKSD